MGFGRGVSRYTEKQAHRQRQELGPARVDGHDALHPLHALRALRRRRSRASRSSAPTGRSEHIGDRHVHREERRSRAVRQHHRSLPGRRAQQQAVPLQRARVGDGREAARRARTTAPAAISTRTCCAASCAASCRATTRRSTRAGSRTAIASAATAIYSDDRLLTPRREARAAIGSRSRGRTRFERAVGALEEATRGRRRQRLGTLVAPSATLEEAYLLQPHHAPPRQRQHRLPSAAARLPRSDRAIRCAAARLQHRRSRHARRACSSSARICAWKCRSSRTACARRRARARASRS